MTTTSRGTTPPFSSVRHALQAIETIATSGSPRAFIVGTARSGKTSLLREITNLLADLETAFTEYRPGTSAASVPRRSTALIRASSSREEYGLVT